MSRARVVGVLLALSLLRLPTACDDDDSGSRSPDGASADAGDTGPDGAEGDTGGGGDTGGDASVPSQLFLTATASGEDADIGERAECSFQGTFDSIVVTEDGWTGNAVGEVFRDVYRGEERAGFQALVAGESTLTVVDDGVELRWVGDQTGGKRFWTYIEVLEGEEVGEFSYQGTWQCAPLDIDEPGYVDTQIIVDGTWTLSREAP